MLSPLRVFSDPRLEPTFLAPASGSRDWWSSVQAASPQRRRMDGQEAVFRLNKTGSTWPHEAELVSEGKATRKKILTQAWTSHVKGEFDFDQFDTDRGSIFIRHCGNG